MTPAVLTTDISQLFISSGWRQFLLDSHFKLLAPVHGLAELCETQPHLLENTPLVNLFVPIHHNELNGLFSQLALGQRPYISSTIAVLSIHRNRSQLVELMLYPAREADRPGAYIGLMRILPDSLKNVLKQPPPALPQNRQLETVAKLSRQITAILDSDTLLNYAVQSLCRDFSYKFSAVFLLEANEVTLSLKAASNINVKTLAPDFLRVPIGSNTVVGRVAATTEPLLVNNASQNGYLPLNYLPVKIQSELAMPLLSAGQLLGVLAIQSDLPHQYQADDLFILETIADQLAVAIENARLFEERDRRMAELAVFNQIGAVISGSHDLRVMLPHILNRVNALFQVEGVSLMLLEGDELRFAVAIGPGAEEIKSFTLKPGQGIAWSVVETGQTIRVDNVEVDSRHYSEIDSKIDFKTRSLLAVPVQIHDKIIGVIEAINRLDGRSFSRDDESALEFIASSVAIAIENARLFSETEQRIQELAGLLEASRVINTLDLQEILDTIVQRVGGLLRTECTVLYFADYEVRQLRTMALHSQGQHQFSAHTFNFNEGTAGWTFNHGQALIINDVALDDRFMYLTPDSTFITNLISVPLVVKDKAMGVLEASNKLNHENFTTEDKDLLSAFASQAAVALHNARLFEETNRRLAEVSTLYTLADQMTKEVEPTQISHSIVTMLRHALDCSGCCCFLLEQATEEAVFVLRAASGWHNVQTSSPMIDFMAQLAQNLLTRPYPIQITDLWDLSSANLSLPHPFGSTDLPILPAKVGPLSELELRSVVIMPLMVKDRLLGALAVDDKQPRAFGQPESRLLAITAAQLGTAIENSRLYDNLEQRAKELEAALAEVQEVNRLKSEFVETVSHELRTPLTFIRAYVELIIEGNLGEIAPTVQEKLQLLSQKTYAAIRLVEDIVSLQKVESGYLNLTEVPPLEIVNYTVQTATASAAEHNLKIAAKVAPNLPMIRVDIDRISQVFDNLVGNAIRYSRPGTEIKLQAELDEDKIKFSVQDQGPGIPADQLKKIFERFYQVQRQNNAGGYKGSGLGLAIVKQIIEAHQGKLGVESSLGEGSTFYFWLPITQNQTNLEMGSQR
jgi:K+-sensing histidine kinase KdpD